MATMNQVGVGLSGASGTGNFAGTTSPTFVTPVLGAASATSITFGGSVLSTYVQGTWSPTITFDTAGDLSVVYASQTGNYTQIGRLVFASFFIRCTPTFTTSTGALRVGGVAITSSATADATGGATIYAGAITFPAGRTSLNLYMGANVQYYNLVCSGSAVAANSIEATNLTSGVEIQIGGSVLYQAA